MLMIIILPFLVVLGCTSCTSKLPVEKPGTGEPPPTTKIVTPFALPNLNAGGKPYLSTEHPGGVFVIEAFGNLCEPCNENAENVERLAQDYAEKPLVQVLDLSTDAATEDTAEWVERNHPGHPVLHDQSRNLIKKLRIKKTPTVTIVGCTGEAVYQSVGKWGEEKQAEIRAEVDAEILVCEN